VPPEEPAAAPEAGTDEIAVDEAQPDAVEPGPVAAVLCRELFGAGISSISISSVFDQRHAGTRVCWQGLLRIVNRYSYDLVLGDGPALKAHFDLLEIEGDYGTRRMIEAVVQLPLGDEELLKGRIGETMTFGGELLQADGLMHRIFLRAGSIQADPSASS
jgi:hypothetical protein